MKGQSELHVWVDVHGDAGTPSRFWKRTFYTDEEYQNLSDEMKLRCRKIQPCDIRFLTDGQKALIKGDA